VNNAADKNGAVNNATNNTVNKNIAVNNTANNTANNTVNKNVDATNVVAPEIKDEPTIIHVKLNKPNEPKLQTNRHMPNNIRSTRRITRTVRF
jgi:hypothetical protein